MANLGVDVVVLMKGVTTAARIAHTVGVTEGLCQVEYVFARHARAACMEGWTMRTTLRNKMV